jgi:hypothetical protein
MADQGQYTSLGAILNDIQSSDLEGSDKQFLTQLFAMRERASKMPPGKVRALRQRLVKACGGIDGLNVFTVLWMESCMGRLGICIDSEGPAERLDVKRLASRAGIDKKDCHAMLFLVAQSLPGFNGGSAGCVQ